MWIVIIIVIILLIAYFVHDHFFYKGVVLAINVYKNSYYLEFKDGKKTLCELIALYTYEKKDYNVYVPTKYSDNITPVPEEDIFILEILQDDPEKTILAFPSKEIREVVYKKLLSKKYKNYTLPTK